MIQRAFGEDGNGDDYAAYVIAMEECKKLETQRNELLEALENIKHSVAQAIKTRNDWHREFLLIRNLADSAIAKAKGETP